MAAKQSINIQKQAKEIIKRAKALGTEQSLLFITTFNRYIVQLSNLEKLEAELENSDVIVSKEYVKGRENYYIHPVIKAYDRACSTADGTAKTLIKILDGMKAEPKNDEFISFILGKK